MATAPVTSADTAEDHTLNNETFSVARDTTPAAAAESPFIFLKNPTGNAVNLNILSIVCAAISSLGSATGVQTVVRVYSNPTVTVNGTAMTINKQRVGSVIASVMQAFSVPTVTANGALLDVFAISSQGESTVDDIIDYTLILQPNNTLLITVQGTVNGPSEVAVVVEWSEF
jgi:hypothetical protein